MGANWAPDHTFPDVQICLCPLSYSPMSHKLWKTPIGIWMRGWMNIVCVFLFICCFFWGFSHHPASVHASCKYTVWPCGFTDMGVELLKICEECCRGGINWRVESIGVSRGNIFTCALRCYTNSLVSFSFFFLLVSGLKCHHDPPLARQWYVMGGWFYT